MLQRPDQFTFFKPSPETILRCLSTRKSDIKIGNTIKPGLIGCEDFGRDAMLFSIGIGLEVFGILAIVQNSTLLAAVGWTAGAVAFDCVLAVVLHFFLMGKSVLLRAEIIEAQTGLGNFSNRNLQNRNAWVIEKEAEIRKRKIYGYLAGTAIVVFCILKIVIYFFSAGSSVSTSLFLLLVFYIVVAYVHLTTTGYVIAALWADKSWKSDIKKYQKTQLNSKEDGNFGTANAQRFQVNSEGIRENSMPPVMRAGETLHQVVTIEPFKRSEDGSTTPGTYELQCRGVLMDDEVRQLLAPVSMDALEARQAIALRCMVYQLGLVQVRQGDAT